MAALKPDQLEIDADGATARPPGTRVIPEPGRYDIDTTFSAVTFRTRRLFGLAPVRGSFAIRTGTITITEPLTDSSIHAEIDPASFRTDNGQRAATFVRRVSWTPTGTRSSPSDPKA